MVKREDKPAENVMLGADAGRLSGASRYQRNEVRKDTRAGYHERSLQTKADDGGGPEPENP